MIAVRGARPVQAILEYAEFPALVVKVQFMQEFGIEYDKLTHWFSISNEPNYTKVSVPVSVAKLWPVELAKLFRMCYVSDSELAENIKTSGVASEDIIRSAMPSRGSIRSGEFGEIMATVFQAIELSPKELLDPKKLRLKIDNNTAAPKTDVVNFSLPRWPEHSDNDWIYCAEVKTKATDSSKTPIVAAIEDSQKDKISRLADTLVWFRKRIILNKMDTMTLPQINRFINLTESPPVKKRYSAIVFLDADLVSEEMKSFPKEIPDDCRVVVVAIPGIRELYNMIYRNAELAK